MRTSPSVEEGVAALEARADALEDEAETHVHDGVAPGRARTGTRVG